jgi:hypothetical protein
MFLVADIDVSDFEMSGIENDDENNKGMLVPF